MKKPTLLFAFFSILAAASDIAVAGNNRSGADVVKEVCAKCHATGENGAPKIGNLSDWSPRMSQGITTLTGHAIRGFKGMPAHGGDSKLSDLEMTRAIIYMMVPKSGAHADLDKPMVVSQISGKKLYGTHCRNCHATGKDGAPRSDDFKAWGARLNKGIDGLAESAISGHNKMPSRGGLASITDAEVKAAVIHMVSLASSKYATQQVGAKP